MGSPLGTWQGSGSLVQCINTTPARCRIPADSCPPFHFSKIPRSFHQKLLTFQILAVLLKYLKRVWRVQKCFYFLQLCNEFCNVPESELSNYTTLNQYSTDANSYARPEAARSQLHGRNMWRTTLSVQICCGYELGCLIFSSSDLKTMDYGTADWWKLFPPLVRWQHL